MESSKGASSASGQLETLSLRQAQLEDDLRRIEKQIFDLETHYIERTQSYGNVVVGWDGFLSCRLPGNQTIRRGRINPKDRIFSISSTTAPKDDIEEE
ncbi:hypothetical protein PBRA_006536 [Plasmodiophora brassicae]|uniref:Chromatin modification-related protein MEAF6 n=1 Tax=Plasmodiophora brassicae TaxID=37360 RepID=A0A0G4IT69_PLABS|nr:hypothetical protein PBRA_006536 [Plasmodiophora brassicae]